MPVELGRTLLVYSSLVAIVIVILASAFGLPPWNTAVVEDSAKVPIITDCDCGKEISAKVGETVTCRLSAQPGTGYRWQLSKASSASIAEVGESSFQADDDPGKSQVGARQVQIIRFKVEASGRHKLELQYRRPWEKERPAARECAVTLQVN